MVPERAKSIVRDKVLRAGASWCPNGPSPLYVTKSSEQGHHVVQHAMSVVRDKSPPSRGIMVPEQAKSVVRDKVLRRGA